MWIVEDIDIELFGTDGLLKYMAQRANRIRRLRLFDCKEITYNVLTRFVKKFSLLEEFEYSGSNNLSKDCLEIIGQCCPLLKSLNLERLFFLETMRKLFLYSYDKSDDDVFAIAKTMPGLRHLELHGIALDNVGLIAILDSCPLLESLDLRDCFCYLSPSLEKRCREKIKDSQFPNYSSDDRYYLLL
ncbi:putative F-box/LRR-repeat protein 23 [Trifolium pratense]|uniref:putative F-box/LRR-repeat protein 23 n=1 Tax=Trifolium pratense TaxID=57577 RepID=UPI001E69098B|nr:putative F-box/LRR-repeat protein 23 [Trifolium pratense]